MLGGDKMKIAGIAFVLFGFLMAFSAGLDLLLGYKASEVLPKMMSYFVMGEIPERLLLLVFLFFLSYDFLSPLFRKIKNTLFKKISSIF